MKKPVRSLMEQQAALTATVLLVLAAVSGYFTYLGAAALQDAAGSGWQNRISAAVYALGVSCLTYLIWTYALHVAPRMPTARTRATAAAIILAGCPVQVAVSSYNNVLGLAKDQSLEIHMEKKGVVRAEEALDATYRRAKLSERLIPDLEAAAARYARLAASERCCGALTGVPGSGGIAETLETAGEQIGELIRSIRAAGERTESLAATARQHLEKMRGIVADEGPAQTRMPRMATEAEMLRAALSGMNNQTLTKSVGRAMAGLPTSIPRRATSANTRIAQAQKDAWNRILEDLARTGETIAAAAATIGAAPAPAAYAFERISVVSAVWTYARDLIPYWAGGIALDLGPTIVIAFLMLAAAAGKGRDGSGGDPGCAPSGIGGITVQELLDANTALKTLKGQNVDVWRVAGEASDGDIGVDATTNLPGRDAPGRRPNGAGGRKARG